jgi:hypothetical protein
VAVDRLEIIRKLRLKGLPADQKLAAQLSRGIISSEQLSRVREWQVSSPGRYRAFESLVRRIRPAVVEGDVTGREWDALAESTRRRLLRSAERLGAEAVREAPIEIPGLAERFGARTARRIQQEITDTLSATQVGRKLLPGLRAGLIAEQHIDEIARLARFNPVAAARIAEVLDLVKPEVVSHEDAPALVERLASLSPGTRRAQVALGRASGQIGDEAAQEMLETYVANWRRVPAARREAAAPSRTLFERTEAARLAEREARAAERAARVAAAERAQVGREALERMGTRALPPAGETTATAEELVRQLTARPEAARRVYAEAVRSGLDPEEIMRQAAVASGQDVATVARNRIVRALSAIDPEIAERLAVGRALTKTQQNRLGRILQEAFPDPWERAAAMDAMERHLGLGPFGREFLEPHVAASEALGRRATFGELAQEMQRQRMRQLSNRLRRVRDVPRLFAEAERLMAEGRPVEALATFQRARDLMALRGPEGASIVRRLASGIVTPGQLRELQSLARTNPLAYQLLQRALQDVDVRVTPPRTRIETLDDLAKARLFAEGERAVLPEAGYPVPPRTPLAGELPAPGATTRTVFELAERLSTAGSPEELAAAWRELEDMAARLGTTPDELARIAAEASPRAVTERVFRPGPATAAAEAAARPTAADWIAAQLQLAAGEGAEGAAAAGAGAAGAAAAEAAEPVAEAAARRASWLWAPRRGWQSLGRLVERGLIGTEEAPRPLLGAIARSPRLLRSFRRLGGGAAGLGLGILADQLLSGPIERQVDRFERSGTLGDVAGLAVPGALTGLVLGGPPGALAGLALGGLFGLLTGDRRGFEGQIESMRRRFVEAGEDPAFVDEVLARYRQAHRLGANEAVMAEILRPLNERMVARLTGQPLPGTQAAVTPDDLATRLLTIQGLVAALNQPFVEAVRNAAQAGVRGAEAWAAQAPPGTADWLPAAARTQAALAEQVAAQSALAQGWEPVLAQMSALSRARAQGSADLAALDELLGQLTDRIPAAFR